jgi:starch phosphorylase
MRATRTFAVVPSVPPELAGLHELTANLAWTWDSSTKALFGRLDPASWIDQHGDPIRMLASITADRWAELAADPRIVAAVSEARDRLRHNITEPRWFQGRTGSPLAQVAYFSPEFGLSETLPQYSGGLGVLAGDHLKAASDLGVPLVAVGLLYAEGYFRQRLNADGYQEERYPRLDRQGLAITDTGVRVHVDIAGEQVQIAVWKVLVGRIELYLLDTAIDSNSEGSAAITNRLYGGDSEHRLRQEIVLGIGGVRALRALGIHPQVFHTNEGHAGFLSLERIRECVQQFGLSFEEAVQAVRAGGVFTTHTPVPAGIDRFDQALMQRYFAAFAQECGATFEQLMSLGHRPDEAHDLRFNMAVMGLQLSARSNGVAQLHGKVSREMFNGMWPGTPVHETPIGAITNGVHAHTWVGDHIEPLLSQGVGPMWDGADAASWQGIDTVPGAEIWAARRQGRDELVRMVRRRMGEGLLDPDALTIGFARRFATYKRATLLLAQADRLRRLLLSSDRPVQFVFAGKAHPADTPGKDMIRDIELFARQLDVGHCFVFVPDYDMSIARTMYHGCDVWLNNPRRPLEACGTSGMKAALNGALNCSVLDGWWDECYDGSNGWAIMSAEDDPDLGRRDQREATHLFGLLEREIVPLFYDRGGDGVPHGWVARMRSNWRSLGPFVTASRMVRDYVTELYEPAAASGTAATADGCARARALQAFATRVRAQWPSVKIGNLATDTAPAHEMERRSAEVEVDMDGLQPSDVRVELLHGPVDSEGNFVDPPTINAMTAATGRLFTTGFTVTEAGAYGVTARVLPWHPDMVSPVELGLVAWAT